MQPLQKLSKSWMDRASWCLKISKIIPMRVSCVTMNMYCAEPWPNIRNYTGIATWRANPGLLGLSGNVHFFKDYASQIAYLYRRLAEESITEDLNDRSNEAVKLVSEFLEEFYQRLLGYFLSSLTVKPCHVAERVGEVAYRLQLAATAKIHPVFHVSMLKRSKGIQDASTSLPILDEDGQLILKPVAILARRIAKKNNSAITQLLIQWSHLPESEATWDDYKDITTAFPELKSWGQDLLKGGSIVMIAQDTEDTKGAINKSETQFKHFTFKNAFSLTKVQVQKQKRKEGVGAAGLRV
ncbi:hypothetical protein BUALT_Bualt18G0058200 [Buddleja alternifolia]|uniref:Chromo domain-containing protein n=1 Tax=Buddleja alternifolia TaxID=168488 RepID=A0AAV6W8Z1_9LAMI|nr:hypothetical protein BUALT_Bualt18G0058200 [Buddleja alternifolia]